MYCLWPLLCYNDRAEQFQQGSYGSQSLKYLLSGPRQKTFATPGLKHQIEFIVKHNVQLFLLLFDSLSGILEFSSERPLYC